MAYFPSAHDFLAKRMARIQHDLKGTAQSSDLLNVLAIYKMLTLKTLMLHHLGEVSGTRTGLEILSSARSLPIYLFTLRCLCVNFVLTDSWLQWLLSSAKQLASGNWRLYSLQDKPMANKYFPLPQLLKYLMLIWYLQQRLRCIRKSRKLDLCVERAGKLLEVDVYGRNLGGTRFKGGLGCLGKGTLGNLEEAFKKAGLETSGSDVVKRETEKCAHTHPHIPKHPPTHIHTHSLTVCSSLSHYDPSIGFMPWKHICWEFRAETVFLLSCLAVWNTSLLHIYDFFLPLPSLDYDQN